MRPLKAHPWTFYVVLDANGRMLRACTANDPRLASVAGLPVTTSKALPAHIALPGKGLELLANGVVDANVGSDPYAQEMHFFVNHMLKNGVRSG